MAVEAGTLEQAKDRSRIWIGLGLALVAGVVAIVAYAASTGGAAAVAEAHEPATVTHIAGSDEARVTLAQSAIKRLDVQTATVATTQIKGKARMVVPYGAVIYDATGQAWVYASPEPRTFVRQRITIDRIEGARVILSAGLTAGSKVATVGVQELYGTEFDIGH